MTIPPICESCNDQIDADEANLCYVCAAALLHRAEHAEARVAELEAVALNALYHHQGANSTVGQPIRKTLGIGRYAPLTPAQLEIARRVSGLGNE